MDGQCDILPWLHKKLLEEEEHCHQIIGADLRSSQSCTVGASSPNPFKGPRTASNTWPRSHATPCWEEAISVKTEIRVLEVSKNPLILFLAFCHSGLSPFPSPMYSPLWSRCLWPWPPEFPHHSHQPSHQTVTPPPRLDVNPGENSNSRWWKR